MSTSQSAHMSNTELVGIHVSLAQTYEDMKQYNWAVEHYMKEIECRGEDHEQVQIHTLGFIPYINNVCRGSI